jgi:hypothetical protein
MADGVSFKMVTEQFTKALDDRQRRMPGAAMWAVREAGRVAKKTARAQTPVLKDKQAASVAQMRKDRKFHAAGGVGPTKTGGTADRPIRGLLRASIGPSKNVKRLGPHEVSLKVGPRGERTHLYAAKIEKRAHMMAAGEAAAQAAMKGIAERAFARVWKGR